MKDKFKGIEMRASGEPKIKIDEKGFMNIQGEHHPGVYVWQKKDGSYVLIDRSDMKLIHRLASLDEEELVQELEKLESKKLT